MIQVVLSGGPSHMETYDPKPDAPTGLPDRRQGDRDVRPGHPRQRADAGHARAMDKMAIVRSLTHETSDHFAGLHWILTGFASTQQQQNQNERPSIGSIVAKLKGANGPGVPPYVAMSEGAIFGGLFQGGSYLGPGYNPFNLDGDPSGDMKVRNLEPPKGLDARPPRRPQVPARQARHDQPPARPLRDDGRARQVHRARPTRWSPAPRPARRSTSRARTPGSATATAGPGSARAACWPAGWSRRA